MNPRQNHLGMAEKWLTANSVWQILKDFIERSGIKKTIGPRFKLLQRGTLNSLLKQIR